MKLTATKSGYYVVLVDGVVVSQHSTEREAAESAINREAANPALDVRYRHDYEVRVEASKQATSLMLSGVGASVENS